MAPSAIARVIAILVALVVLPLFGVYGATLGIAALTIGFAPKPWPCGGALQGRSDLHGRAQQRI